MAVGTVLFLVPLEGVVEGCVYVCVLASLLCVRIQKLSVALMIAVALLRLVRRAEFD